LLRAAITDKTPLGLRAQSYVDAGLLVPDALVNELITEKFQRPGRPTRFVMDGYPRTVSQARAFDALLASQSLEITRVLLLVVDDEEIVRRLSGRWSCPAQGCKATYHTENNPPKMPGICDDCGAMLVQRSDDREETVKARLLVYHGNRTELVPYYEQRGLLREVPGHGEIEQVYNNLVKALDNP